MGMPRRWKTLTSADRGHRPVTVGVVGCGQVARKHFAALGRLREVRIVGVCDHDGAAQRAAARLTGAEAYGDLRAMLEARRPEVLHVLTPPQSHCELGCTAMRAGCHVLVEKPLAMTAAEADEMMRVAAAAGVRLGVCHNFLFEPGVLRAVALLRAGALGRLVSADIYWRIRHGEPRDRFRSNEWIHELPGGVFQEVAPHALYLQAAFLGQPRIAGLLLKRIGGDVVRGPDELRVLLEGDHALGSVAISVHAEPHQVTMRIYGTEMTLSLDLTTNALVRLRTKGTGRIVRLARSFDQACQLAGGTLGNALRTVCGRMRFGHESLIRAFYANLRRGGAPPVGGAEGRLVVTLLEEINAALAATAPGHR
jgi:predicted dehydrogenase